MGISIARNRRQGSASSTVAAAVRMPTIHGMRGNRQVRVLIVSVVARGTTTDDQGCRERTGDQDKLASFELSKQIDVHLVVLLSSPPLAVVGGRRLELNTLKGDDIGVHIRRTHSQVASCTHTGGLWGHLRALVSLGGMLDQLDDLFAVLDLCADTNHEASDPKQLSISVDQAWWLRMHHRVDLLEGEGGAELEIVAAVASPVVGSQEEASVDSGGHLEVVADGLVQAEQFLVLLSWVEIRALLVGDDLRPSFWSCQGGGHGGRRRRGGVVARVVAAIAVAVAVAVSVAHHAPDGHARGRTVWMFIDTAVVIAVVGMVPWVVAGGRRRRVRAIAASLGFSCWDRLTTIEVVSASFRRGTQGVVVFLVRGVVGVRWIVLSLGVVVVVMARCGCG